MSTHNFRDEELQGKVSEGMDCPEISLPILDIQVTPCTLEQLLNWFEKNIGSKSAKVLVGHNLHSVYLFHSQPKFKSFYERAAIILCDGFPIALAASRRIALPTSQLRIGSTDWIPEISKLRRVNRVAVVGATQFSNEAFVSYISSRLDSPEIYAENGENWGPEKASKVAVRLMEFRPEITFIALGMPSQEYFVFEKLEKLTGVIALVGGAFDQLSGVQKNAPRWLGKLGLEWLWRLILQPSRLGHRYLVEPWLLLFKLISKVGRGKR